MDDFEQKSKNAYYSVILWENVNFAQKLSKFKIYDANSPTLMDDFKKNIRKNSIIQYKFERKIKKCSKKLK